MQTEEYSIIDVVYPVGSIYMSVNTSNPSTLFPNTTWQKIEGRFLLGSSSSYTSGATGGSKDAVVVSHSHKLPNSAIVYSSSYSGSIPNGTAKQYGTNTQAQLSVDSAGVSGTNKNMPPYLVVNIWKRTA